MLTLLTMGLLAPATVHADGEDVAATCDALIGSHGYTVYLGSGHFTVYTCYQAVAPTCTWKQETVAPPTPIQVHATVALCEPSVPATP